jgi:hypothetical protein
VLATVTVILTGPVDGERDAGDWFRFDEDVSASVYTRKSESLIESSFSDDEADSGLTSRSSSG